MGYPRSVSPSITGLFDIPNLDGALCKGHPDPNVFFRNSEKSRAKRAKICSGCPVRKVCECYGETQEYGAWGSVTRRTND